MLGGGAGCNSDGGGVAGPCYVRYAEPLFTITNVTDSHTGRGIAQVVLRGFTYQGRSDLGPTFLTDHLGLAPRNVLVQRDVLTCTVACAFGASEGRYILIIGAAGYRDTTLTVDAQFARGEGNCPRTLSGGTTLSLVLTPE